MKRGKIWVYFIASILLVSLTFAAHTTTLSVNPTSSYETLQDNYIITVQNDNTSRCIML